MRAFKCDRQHVFQIGPLHRLEKCVEIFHQIFSGCFWNIQISCGTSFNLVCEIAQLNEVAVNHAGFTLDLVEVIRVVL